MPVDLQTVKQLWPEIVLVLFACWILIGGALNLGRLSSRGWAIMALGAYAVAGLALARQYSVQWGEFGSDALLASTGPISVDLLGYSVAWLGLLVGVVFTMAGGYRMPSSHGPEYHGLLMFLVVGVMLAGAANDLVLLFVALEMVSIPTYALLYFSRRDRAVGEATAKYFFLSILASALLLYGMSFLYGMAGTTVIAGGPQQSGETIGIREALAALSESGADAPMNASDGELEAAAEPKEIGSTKGRGLESLAPLALVLMFAGLGFKLAAAPFHFYAPDVYQGVSNANAGLLAAAPKIVGAVALIKLGYVAFSQFPSDFAWQLALVVSLLTMTLGNVCALWQQNVRRLLAYSSIAHGGYMLIGLAAAAAAPSAGVEFSGGVAGILFYLFVYVAASAGAFAALDWLSDDNRQVSGVAELAGLGKRRPLAAAVLGVCMFSLSGIPPLAGFWGKFTLFNSAVRVAVGSSDPLVSVWFTVLAVVGALNAAIGAAYYLRVIATMYFGAPAPVGASGAAPIGASGAAPIGASGAATVEAEAGGRGSSGGLGALAAMGACGVLVLFVGAVPGRFVRLAELSERAISTTFEETGAAANSLPPASKRADAASAEAQSTAVLKRLARQSAK